MTMAQVELSLALTRSTARQLRQLAQAHGVTDAAVVEQALALLFERDDGALRQDYWLSVASMQGDWEAMPDDWIADEVHDATSSW
ncbi:hypothetical protein [Candidatus Amarolinea aalborgensis]|uniref:hypothetical protein n=1 Tax=Candidatus Amarolinea aalborgensis TaxID=2249329 RepID=UPI003BF9EB71